MAEHMPGQMKGVLEVAVVSLPNKFRGQWFMFFPVLKKHKEEEPCKKIEKECE